MTLRERIWNALTDLWTGIDQPDLDHDNPEADDHDAL